MKKIDVFSIEFWEQVQRDYAHCTDPYQHDYYICNSSGAFKAAWEQLQTWTEINVLAKKFLKEYNKEVFTGSRHLFYMEGIENSINIRKEFIDWCIEKHRTQLNIPNSPKGSGLKTSPLRKLHNNFIFKHLKKVKSMLILSIAIVGGILYCLLENIYPSDTPPSRI